MTMKLKIIDNQYGCFLVKVVCDFCQKSVINIGFSWDRQHIGVGEKEKIREYVRNELETKDMHYCYRCGTEL